MRWEEAATIVALGVGLATLYRLIVSPVVKDRNEALERIRKLEAEVRRLEGRDEE